MKKYIKSVWDLTVEDRKYMWNWGLCDGELPELVRVLKDYPVGTYIMLETKTYSGYIYKGSVEIIDDNTCLVNLTFKDRPSPQKRLNFKDTAEELRRLYIYSQGRHRSRFKIDIKESKNVPEYIDTFYV